MTCIFIELKEIKQYLTKIGSTRRESSKSAREKLRVAQILYNKLESILISVNEKIKLSEVGAESLTNINSVLNN